MTGSLPDVAVAVLGRAPIPGRVKTRLIPALGSRRAAMLQARLLARTLETVRAWHGDETVTLWGDPGPDAPAWRSVSLPDGVVLAPQPSGDLGERMRVAAESALAANTPVVLVGTDCPGLTTADLTAAAAWLRRGRAVLGPATDGGYWLLGLPQPAPFLFDAMPWGGDQVLLETRRRLWRRDWRWAELAARADVDRPDDLPMLAQWPELAEFALA